jgi:hypothetical protein
VDIRADWETPEGINPDGIDPDDAQAGSEKLFAAVSALSQSELGGAQLASNDRRMGMIRAAANGTYTVDWQKGGNFYPLDCCPHSPLCGECCEWHTLKGLLLCTWSRSTSPMHRLPTPIFRHLLGYLCLHPRPSMMDCPVNCTLRVKWRDPLVPPNNLRPAEGSNTRGGDQAGRAGTHEFAYYDPASIAMELHAMSTGLCDDPYQAMRCGPMRLTGTPDNWWSAVLNFARYGSVAP